MRTLYQLLEWPASPAIAHSVPLGRRLRGRAAARRLCRRLRLRGRDVFAAPIRVRVR